MKHGLMYYLHPTARTESRTKRKKIHFPLACGGRVWYNTHAFEKLGGFRTLCPGLGITGLDES